MTKEARVKSLILEVEAQNGETTVVVRDPMSPGAKYYALGSVPNSEIVEVLQRFGIHGRAASVPPPMGLGYGSSRQSWAPLAPRDHDDVVDSAPTPTQAQILSEALHRLSSSVLRTGRSALSTSVDDALAALRELARQSTSPALARALARIEHGLGPHGNLDASVLALAGLGRIAEVVSHEEKLDIECELLGENTEGELVEARELLELGRVRERGIINWETRLLLDLGTGDLYRETGPLMGNGLSHGAAGRRVNAILAGLLCGGWPARLRIYQYEYQPAATAHDLHRAVGLAQQALALPPQVLQDPLLLLAVPRAVFVAPKTVTLEHGHAQLLDATGAGIPLIDDTSSGACDSLIDQIEMGYSVVALAGALVLQVAGICLTPWSALVRKQEEIRLIPLAL